MKGMFTKIGTIIKMRGDYKDEGRLQWRQVNTNRWDDYKEEKWLQVGGWLQMRQAITKSRGDYKEG